MNVGVALVEPMSVEAVGILVLAVKGAFELTGGEGALANLHRLVHLKMEMKSATFSHFFRGTRIAGESSFPVEQDLRP